MPADINDWSKKLERMRQSWYKENEPFPLSICLLLFLLKGMAIIGGMCNKASSCGISQDTGLTLSFTVAHEMGHK